MRRSVLVSSAVVLSGFLAAAFAEDPPPRADAPDPAAFLKAAHAKHADVVAAGVSSFTAKFRLRRADDENVAKVRDQAGFAYSFTAPDLESFDFKDTMEVVRKPLKDSLSGMWRETTGTLWFPVFEAAPDLKLEAAGASTVVSGTGKETGAFRATFDTATHRLAEAVFADTATRRWTCDASDRGFRVRRREVLVNGSPVYEVTWDVFRCVRGFVLPTVLRIAANGKRTEFLLEYVRLNGEPAWADDPDPAAVKARIEETDRGWKGTPDDAKIQKLRDLAEFESDVASAAVARLGLKDASPAVREAAAETLGVMRRPNAVPALVAALDQNEKEIRAYLRIIEALGELGDPRAVDPLSKDWWNQRIREYGVVAAQAKIRALGKIRDAKSVDALLDTFTVASDDKIAAFKADLVLSLKQLTGQDFLYDRKAWSDWWKKSRASFKF